MPLTLDEIFVSNSRQMLGSIAGVLEKGRAHAEANGISEEEMLGLRFHDSMWPLPNQIQSMWVHSAYTIDQAKGGEFRPNIQDVPTSWDEMQAMIAKALARLDALEEGELEAIADQPMYFVAGGKRMFKFTTQDFLLTFNMPNVHFHATTAYDLLRSKGVDIGKFDFLGAIRTQPM